MSESATKQGHAPLDWGASREMNALEALMWRGEEADPRLRSTICSFGVLDCAPDWQRFLAACEWGTRMVPRFRQKVVEPAFGFGNPVWVNDPDFDLHYHVRRQRISEGGGWREALACAEQIAMTPFDRARSPLEVVLFEGLPEGRAAMLLKMHHSATDGIGGFQLFSKLHSKKREHNPSKPQPAEPPPEWKTPRDVLREQLERDARQLLGNVRDGAASLLSRLQHPVAAVTDAVNFTSSLRRVLAEPAAEGSPLLRRRSLSWRFQAFDVSFPDLRAAAKAAHASLNDAFLAALLGAFRLYHEKLGVRDRDDADRDPDLGAARGRSRGRQPLHRCALRRARRRRRPGAADEEDGRARARRAQRARARRDVARRAAARAIARAADQPARRQPDAARTISRRATCRASRKTCTWRARRSSASTASARCRAAPR